MKVLRRFARLAGPSVLSLACAAAALAQITVDNVSIGWDRSVIPQRWIPVTLQVTGGPAGFSGVLRVEYPQDPTQHAIIAAPVAATPNQTTFVTVPICVSSVIDPIEITVVGPKGVEFRDTFSGGQVGQFSGLESLVGRSMILVAGASSATELVPRPSLANAIDPTPTGPKDSASDDQKPNTDSPHRRARRWEQVKYIKRSIDRLPADSVLYDAFECVVLAPPSPGQTLGTREAAALRAWVETGGRLAVLVGPGDDWRQWATDADGVEQVELTPSTTAEPPSDLTKVLSAAGHAAKQDPESGEWKPAPSVSGRPMALTPAGTGSGWSLRWRTDNTHGLLAEGPLGLGVVTLIGLDPRTVSKTVSSSANRAVWKDALHTLMDPAMKRATDEMRFWGFGETRIASTLEETTALAQAANRVASAPAIGIGVFIGIAAGMSLLTLLIGPIDAFGLRVLKLRHRSWLTALGWIGIGSLGAYILPLVLRSGPSSLMQFSIIDAVLRPDGTAASARRATVTGIYAQRAARFEIADPDRLSAGIWTRGVASGEIYGRSRTVFSPLPLTIASFPTGRSVLTPAITVPQWSFRTLMEDAPAQVPQVTLERELDRELRVTVRNLGVNAIITDAWIEQGNTRRRLGATESGAGTWLLETRTGGITETISFEAAPFGLIPEAEVPGASARSESLRIRRDSGQPMLIIQAEHLDMPGRPLASVGKLTTSHAGVFRLALPAEARP